jgi:succinoglycan biosynthesis protein ExoA
LAVGPALALLLLAPAWPIAALPAAAWALGCCVYGAGLALHERSPCGLMSGPAAMIMHAGWSLGFWARLLSSGWCAPTKDPGPEALNER